MLFAFAFGRVHAADAEVIIMTGSDLASLLSCILAHAVYLTRLIVTSGDWRHRDRTICVVCYADFRSEDQISLKQSC